MKEAIASIGPWTGLRIYEKGKTDRPILDLDANARATWIRLAKDALDASTIVIRSEGEDYLLPAGVPLARQILAAIAERG